jgi:hypothetical protein
MVQRRLFRTRLGMDNRQGAYLVTAIGTCTPRGRALMIFFDASTLADALNCGCHGSQARRMSRNLHRNRKHAIPRNLNGCGGWMGFPAGTRVVGSLRVD